MNETLDKTLSRKIRRLSVVEQVIGGLGILFHAVLSSVLGFYLTRHFEIGIVINGQRRYATIFVVAGMFGLGIYLLRFIPPGPFLIRYKEYDTAAGDIRSAKDLYRKWKIFRSKRCLIKAQARLEGAIPYFPDEEDVLLLQQKIHDAMEKQ